MANFLLIYFFGIVVGVLASLILNVQFKRPGLAKSIALIVLGVLLTVFIASRNSTMPVWLLTLLWAGIGLLAGLGSRGSRSAI